MKIKYKQEKGYCEPNISFTQLDNKEGNIRALFDDFKFIPVLHIKLDDTPQFKKHKLSVKFLIQESTLSTGY